MNKPLLLIILDGFGIAEEYGNAIKAANKPNLDRIFNRNPITQIFQGKLYRVLGSNCVFKN